MMERLLGNTLKRDGLWIWRRDSSGGKEEKVDVLLFACMARTFGFCTVVSGCDLHFLGCMAKEDTFIFY